MKQRTRSRSTLINKRSYCGLLIEGRVTQRQLYHQGVSWASYGQFYQWRVPCTEWTTHKNPHYWEVPRAATIPRSPTLRPDHCVSFTEPEAERASWGSLTSHEPWDSVTLVIFAVKNSARLVSLLGHSASLYKAVLVVTILWPPGVDHSFRFKAQPSRTWRREL